jgi:hypothetical protein
MLYPPLRSPELPNPAIDLPIMSIVEDVAAPHTADPNSKIPKKQRKVHWKEILMSATTTEKSVLCTFMLNSV